MYTSLKLVMFDLDGTLIETGAEIARAVNATLAHFAYAPVTQQQINGWIGQGTAELLVKALAAGSGESHEQIRNGVRLAAVKQRFAEDYLQFCGSASQLYPQVREVLIELKARGTRPVVHRREVGLRLLQGGLRRRLGARVRRSRRREGRGQSDGGDGEDAASDC